MTAIASSAILANRPYGQNGHRKVIFRFVDSTGAEHKQTHIVPPGADVNARLADCASQLDQALIVKERGEYIRRMEEGNNPFRDDQGNPVDPEFSSRNAMLTTVLQHFLSLPDAAGLTAAVPYFANLTDAELMALLGVDQAKVDEIRAKASDVADIGASISAYVPPLEGTP